MKTGLSALREFVAAGEQFRPLQRKSAEPFFLSALQQSNLLAGGDEYFNRAATVREPASRLLTRAALLTVGTPLGFSAPFA
jgi:hypothetical protein